MKGLKVDQITPISPNTQYWVKGRSKNFYFTKWAIFKYYLEITFFKLNKVFRDLTIDKY